MSWLLQGILTSLVAAGLIAGGAFMLTWAKKKWPQNAELIRYWLTSFTCLAIITALVFAAFGYTPFRKPAPVPKEVTQDNIGDYVKEWCEHLGLSVQRQNIPPQGATFLYIVRNFNGDDVVIAQGKDKPGYLQFRSEWAFTAEHLAVVNKMSRKQFIKFVNSMNVEQSREHDISASFNWVSGQGHISTAVAVLQFSPPITNLNEGAFSSDLDHISNALAHIKALVNLDLEIEPFNIPRSATPSH